MDSDLTDFIQTLALEGKRLVLALLHSGRLVVRERVAAIGTAIVLGLGAAVVAVVAIVLFLVGLGDGIADLAALPAWAGKVIAGALVLGGFVLAAHLRSSRAHTRRMAELRARYAELDRQAAARAGAAPPAPATARSVPPENAHV